MPKIYAYQPPNNQVLDFCAARIREIEGQMQQLVLEKGIHQRVIDEFKSKVCHVCTGSGAVMSFIDGSECDGPRLQKCPECKGVKS